MPVQSLFHAFSCDLLSLQCFYSLTATVSVFTQPLVAFTPTPFPFIHHSSLLWLNHWHLWLNRYLESLQHPCQKAFHFLDVKEDILFAKSNNINSCRMIDPWTIRFSQSTPIHRGRCHVNMTKIRDIQRYYTKCTQFSICNATPSKKLGRVSAHRDQRDV
jgi:hypothetical protein